MVTQKFNKIQMPMIKAGSKQSEDILHRKNFEKKIQTYQEMDKDILIRLLIAMEEQYRKLSDQRIIEVRQFADRISELEQKKEG